MRPEEIADYIARLNSPGGRALLMHEGDTYYVSPDEKEVGQAGVLAFVIARYRTGETRPVRAITVVINIQAKLPEGAADRVNPAQEFASQWIPSPRLKALLYPVPAPGAPAPAAPPVRRGS